MEINSRSSFSVWHCIQPKFIKKQDIFDPSIILFQTQIPQRCSGRHSWGNARVRQGFWKSSLTFSMIIVSLWSSFIIYLFSRLMVILSKGAKYQTLQWVSEWEGEIAPATVFLQQTFLPQPMSRTWIFTAIQFFSIFKVKQDKKSTRIFMTIGSTYKHIQFQASRLSGAPRQECRP